MNFVLVYSLITAFVLGAFIFWHAYRIFTRERRREEAERALIARNQEKIERHSQTFTRFLIPTLQEMGAHFAGNVPSEGQRLMIALYLIEACYACLEDHEIERPLHPHLAQRGLVSLGYEDDVVRDLVNIRERALYALLDRITPDHPYQEGRQIYQAWSEEGDETAREGIKALIRHASALSVQDLRNL